MSRKSAEFLYDILAEAIVDFDIDTINFELMEEWAKENMRELTEEDKHWLLIELLLFLAKSETISFGYNADIKEITI